MNNELIDLYVKGMMEGAFSVSALTKIGHPSATGIFELESYLGRRSGQSRVENPEWAEAQKVLNSPLMKALG